jgi:transposase InsO family protein
VIDAVLSDNGRESCGREDQHPDELFLQLEGIAHKTTRVGRPQSNRIVERLHRTLLDEHLRVQGRTVWRETVAEMQTALDAWLLRYNSERPHQGRGMNGRTPLKAFLDGLPLRPKPDQENEPQPIAA